MGWTRRRRSGALHGAVDRVFGDRLGCGFVPQGARRFSTAAKRRRGIKGEFDPVAGIRRGPTWLRVGVHLSAQIRSCDRKWRRQRRSNRHVDSRSDVFLFGVQHRRHEG